MCGCLSFGGVLEESLGWLGGSGSERRSELAIGGVNGTGGAQGGGRGAVRAREGNGSLLWAASRLLCEAQRKER
jgi:hypothetical protein